MALPLSDRLSQGATKHKQLSNNHQIADIPLEMTQKDNNKTNQGNEQTITDRQERFIQNYLTSGNATQAYIKAGYTDSKSAVANVHKLLRKDCIRQRIADQQAETAVKQGITREKQAERLELIITQSRDKGDYRTLLKAIELQSKLYGLLIDRGITTDTVQEQQLDQAEQQEAKRLAILLMNERNKAVTGSKQEDNKAG